MNRGGYRQGAGRKGSWRHGATQTIRIPVALREELLEIARNLDNREFINNRTYSELNALVSEWRAKCDAEPASSREWQQVRQLVEEIGEFISPEIGSYECGDFAPLGQGYCHRHRRRHNRHLDR